MSCFNKFIQGEKLGGFWQMEKDKWIEILAEIDGKSGKECAQLKWR